mgnify:FL=1
MLVASYVSNKQNMNDTKTYEDFYKFVGAKPHRLGVMSRMYPYLTTSFLTEGLRNVFYMDHKKEQYKSLEAPYFEWDIETNYIKRVEFAAVPEQGAAGEDIIMHFKERYYEKYDIFKIDATRQQCQVVSRPIRKADDFWEYTVRLIDNDYSSILDLDGCQVGMTTRFQSNAMPEMHEEGYIKYQSNVETHRGYITTHRVDVSYSAQFAAMENVFIQVAEGKDKKSLIPTIYKMDKKEKQLLDSFLYARNNGSMFNRTNVDKNGKATIQDPDTGRPIYIGDGVLPQIERYCGKYIFNKMTINVFQTAMNEMVQKSEKPIGNKYIFICNEIMWTMVQNVLSEYLSRFKPCSTYMYSTAKNKYLEVGATFQSHEFAGNQVTFQVDRALSYEWDRKAFGVFIDLTADSVDGKPALQMFTLKGGDFISNRFPGVGGLDGLSSGVVSSAVAASKLINWGYSGVAVFNPYRSYMLIEA